MLKTYYTEKEKKAIKESYCEIQKVFKKDTVRKNDVDEIAKKYKYIATAPQTIKTNPTYIVNCPDNLALV